MENKVKKGRERHRRKSMPNILDKIRIKNPIVKKVLFVIGTVLTVLLSTITVLLCSSIRWMFKTWKHLSMEELIYQLNAPIEGTSTSTLKDYAVSCIPITVLVLLMVIILLVYFRKKKKMYYITEGAAAALSVVLLIGFVSMTWNRLEVGAYLKNQNSDSDFIESNYVDPRDVTLTFPEKKRNLVYIYLESMETTFASEAEGGGFEEGCIPELTQLAQENEDFSGEDTALNGGIPLPNATWTVAGMFAQTSGLPLSIPIEENSMDTQENFFADVINIGDILQQQNYKQTLLIGSDATFGGRRLLFTQHGDYEIIDYGEAKNREMIPEDYRAWWGYEDEKLFEFAKQELLKNAETGEPFNFTMLTADTHFEDGYRCANCPDKYWTSYANVIAHSSSMVSEFVEWIKQQDFYEDTAIVISGDHATMDSDFCEDVSEEYERKVYTAYVNSAVESKNSTRREYSTFDQFPTTLAAMGVQIDGERLGLGTNLFSDIPTLTEIYGLEKESAELKRKSSFMQKLSRIEASDDKLQVEEEQASKAGALVTVEPYNADLSILPIRISDITGIQEVKQINIAFWTQDDMSDVQWIQAAPQADGSYRSDLDIAHYNYKSQPYNIHVYIIGDHERQYLVAQIHGAIGAIQVNEQINTTTGNVTESTVNEDYTDWGGYYGDGTYNENYTNNYYNDPGTSNVPSDGGGGTDVPSDGGSTEVPGGGENVVPPDGGGGGTVVPPDGGGGGTDVPSGGGGGEVPSTGGDVGTNGAVSADPVTVMPESSGVVTP